jgi:hypothetical protein
LEHHGIEVWLDERLIPGEHFDVAIEEALAAADKVIVAWSPASSASQWVRAEAGEGLERGILVPVLLEPTKIPLEFRRVQTLNLTEWQGVLQDRAVDSLVAALQSNSAAQKHRPNAIKEMRSTDRGARIAAEVLGVSKFFASIRIRLRIGQQTFTIRHQNRQFYQVIKVDGAVVSASPWGLLHDHHRFKISASDVEHEADLLLQGEGLSSISGFSLDVDGQEVLRQTVGWRDGLVGYLLYCFAVVSLMFFLFLYIESR